MDETSEVFGCTRGIVPVAGIKRVVSVVTDHKVISFGNNPFFTRLYIADTVIGLEDITLTGSVGLCLVLSYTTRGNTMNLKLFWMRCANEHPKHIEERLSIWILSFTAMLCWM